MKKQSNPYPPIEAVRPKPSPAPPGKKRLHVGVPVAALTMALSALKVEIKYGSSSQIWKEDAKGYVDEITLYLECVKDGDL